MNRILLLRSGEEAETYEDVDVLRTHDIVVRPAGVSQAVAFTASSPLLIVTSKAAVAALVMGGAEVLSAPGLARVAAGKETARAMRQAGSGAVSVPTSPGAAGILDHLPEDLGGQRVLWPRGSDADEGLARSLEERGATVRDPVVYEKRPRKELPGGILSAFIQGEYRAVAVGSLAALDVFLAALKSRGGRIDPSIRWGVIGPETARAFSRYSLPAPIHPSRPRLADLLELLRKETSK